MPGTLIGRLLIGLCVLPRLQLRFAEFLAVSAELRYHKFDLNCKMSATLSP
jgi:hypothetical protein